MYFAVTSCDQILPSVTSCLHVCFMISVKLCFWTMIQNVSKMCPKFGHILDTFLQFFHIKWCVQNVSIMCPKFWTHFGTIIFYGKIEQMCLKFGHIMDIFWIHFEFWTPYGHILDTFWVWTHFGHIMDTFWTLFKDKCPKCVRAHIVHQSRYLALVAFLNFDRRLRENLQFLDLRLESRR